MKNCSCYCNYALKTLKESSYAQIQTMAAEDSSSGAMVKLTSLNYAPWKPQIEDLLCCKELYDPLEKEGKKPNVVKDAN